MTVVAVDDSNAGRPLGERKVSGRIAHPRHTAPTTPTALLAIGDWRVLRINLVG